MKLVRTIIDAARTVTGAAALTALILGAFAPIWVGVTASWLVAPGQHRTHSPLIWVALVALVPIVWLAASHVCDFFTKLVLAVLVGASRASEFTGEVVSDFAALAVLAGCLNLAFFTTYAMSFLAAFIAYVIYRLFEPFLADDEKDKKAVE